jgi:hypothetical protein
MLTEIKDEDEWTRGIETRQMDDVDKPNSLDCDFTVGTCDVHDEQKYLGC